MLACRLHSTLDLVVLDLHELDFLGTAGLAALGQAQLQAEHHGTEFRIVTANCRPVARALMAAGMHRQLPLCPTVNAALSSPPTAQWGEHNEAD
jgi:anti-sigma B factor antagonist